MLTKKDEMSSVNDQVKNLCVEIAQETPPNEHVGDYLETVYNIEKQLIKMERKHEDDVEQTYRRIKAYIDDYKKFVK